jgi:hypothetical protein
LRGGQKNVRSELGILYVVAGDDRQRLRQTQIFNEFFHLGALAAGSDGPGQMDGVPSRSKSMGGSGTSREGETSDCRDCFFMIRSNFL